MHNVPRFLLAVSAHFLLDHNYSDGRGRTKPRPATDVQLRALSAEGIFLFATSMLNCTGLLLLDEFDYRSLLRSHLSHVQRVGPITLCI